MMPAVVRRACVRMGILKGLLLAGLDAPLLGATRSALKLTE